MLPTGKSCFGFQPSHFSTFLDMPRRTAIGGWIKAEKPPTKNREKGLEQWNSGRVRENCECYDIPDMRIANILTLHLASITMKLRGEFNGKYQYEHPR